jgi:hypothetical protein
VVFLQVIVPFKTNAVFITDEVRLAGLVIVMPKEGDGGGVVIVNSTNTKETSDELVKFVA